MSIRLIAKELYRLTKEIEALERALDEEKGPQREDLQIQLQGLRAERERLRKILEGHKTPPAYRVPR